MLPSAVEGHAIVHIEEADTVFLFGGYDGFGVTDKVIKYNLKTGQSAVVFGQTLCERRENLVAERLEGNLIVVAAGWNGHASTNKIDLFRYDSGNDSIIRVDVGKARGTLTPEEEELLNQLQEINLVRNRPCSVAI